MTAQGGDMTDLLTIDEVAERLRVSVLSVRWLRREGQFAPAIKVGRRLVWDARDIDAWLKPSASQGRWRDGSTALQAAVRRHAIPGAGEVAGPLCRNARVRTQG
jgi:excisionase family DNA binding protein